MRRALDVLVRTFGDLALALLCVVLIAQLAARQYWMFELTTHFQVVYFWVAAVLLLGNLLLRRWLHAGIATALAGHAGFLLAPYYLPPAQAAEPGGAASFTVMLINLNYANHKTAAVMREIDAADPDILVLQEVNPRWRSELDALPARFTHSFDAPQDGAFGLWVLSKFELVDIDVQRRGSVPFFHVRYRAGGETLEVVALHPVPPMSADAARRRNELLADAAIYARSSAPRIVVGDLNCTPWSPYFRDFLKATGLRDSARGRGVRGTWFPFQPLFGIPLDHVLVSESIEVLDRSVGGRIGSDHRAVVVELRVTAHQPAAGAGGS